MFNEMRHGNLVGHAIYRYIRRLPRHTFKSPHSRINRLSNLSTLLSKIFDEMAAIDLSNPIVQSYILYSAILALKLLAVGSLTSLVRIGRGTFSNPEDAKAFKGKVKTDDPIVERTRRAHLNDLENIPAFWILGALYLTTGPAAALATMLFRVYTAFRIFHTLVYAVVPLPQPTRALAYLVPYVIKWYMGIQIVFHYAVAL